MNRMIEITDCTFWACYVSTFFFAVFLFDAFLYGCSLKIIYIVDYAIKFQISKCKNVIFVQMYAHSVCHTHATICLQLLSKLPSGLRISFVWLHSSLHLSLKKRRAKESHRHSRSEMGWNSNNLNNSLIIRYSLIPYNVPQTQLIPKILLNKDKNT